MLVISKPIDQFDPSQFQIFGNCVARQRRIKRSTATRLRMTASRSSVPVSIVVSVRCS